MQFSFVDDSLQLRTIAAAGTWPAGSGQLSRRQQRKDVLNLFFQTRPIEDSRILSELLDQLIPLALEVCSRRSPILASVLQKLISVVLCADQTSKNDSDCASPWVKALYVILRTSLIRDSMLLVPRMYMSPSCVQVAEAARAPNRCLGWSAELDPVVSALVANKGTTSGSVVLIQQFGQQGFADLRHTTATGAESASNSSNSSVGSNSWSHEVADPIQEDEAFIVAFSKRNGNIQQQDNSSPLVGGSAQPANNTHDTTGCSPVDAKSVLHGLLRSDNEFFRMCMVRPPSSPHQHHCGMFLGAAHFALSGFPDPFGIVVLSRVETIGGTSLPRLIVHPSLFASPGQGSAIRLGVRGMVSMVEAAAEWGNVLCALRAIVKRASAHDVIAAIGTIGVAAVTGLKDVLHHLSQTVAISQTSVAQRMPAVSPQEVLRAWFHQLVPVTDAFATLADTFVVNINDKTWSASQSLNACGSTNLLSRLHATVARQRPAQHAASSLDRWRVGGTFISLPRKHLSHHTEGGGSMELISHIFSCAMHPFCAILQQWISTGDLADSDPFDEFFIVPSYGETLCGYQVVPDRLPCFLELPTAEKFLAAGVASSVFHEALKQVRHNAFVSAPALTSRAVIFGWAQEQWRGQFDHALERISSDENVPCVQLSRAETTSMGVAKWESYLLNCVEPLADELAWVGKEISLSKNEHDSNSADHEGSSKNDDDRASSNPSVEVLAPSTFGSPQSKGHGDVDALRSSVARSDSIATLAHDDEAVRLRDRAADALKAEFATKMKALKFQEARIRWKSRRLGLKLKRTVAQKDELDIIKAMHAECSRSNRADHSRLTPVGIFVIPLCDAGPVHPAGQREVEEFGQTPGDSSFQCTRDVETPHHAALDYSVDLGSDDARAEDGDGSETVLGSSCNASDTLLRVEDDPQLACERRSNGNAQSEPGSEFPQYLDVFAPVPMSDEEHLQAQCVGFTSNHFAFLRAQRAIEIYDARESAIQELNREALDMQQYLQMCTEASRSSSFLESSWAQPSNDFRWQKELQSTIANNRSLQSSLSYQGNADTLHQYKQYLDELATTVSAMLVPRTLLFVLSPSIGVVAHVLQSFRNVCLLQGPSSVTAAFYEWEQIAFDPDASSVHERPLLRKLFECMNEGFARMWRNAWRGSVSWSRGEATGLPPQNPIQLQLVISLDGLKEQELRSSSTPFDVLPLVSLALDDKSKSRGGELPDEQLDEYFLMLAPHSIRRYSDLFVSLVFWKWAQRALDACWAKGVVARSARRSHRGVWYFCTLARSVICVIVEYIWHGVAQCSKAFEAQCTHRVTLMGITSLDRFIDIHDEFLTAAYDAALLGPQYSRARQQIRIMVHLVESVLHFLQCSPLPTHAVQQTNEAVHIESVQQKKLMVHTREFWGAATMFSSHLKETMECGDGRTRHTSTALTQLIIRIDAALASCRFA